MSLSPQLLPLPETFVPAGDHIERVIETHLCIYMYFLNYVSIFVLYFCVPFTWGSYFACLSYLKHCFWSLYKTYCSSIIPIVLYLTYFTVLDIVSLLCIAPFSHDFTMPICKQSSEKHDSEDTSSYSKPKLSKPRSILPVMGSSAEVQMASRIRRYASCTVSTSHSWTCGERRMWACASERQIINSS
jgi:hypothetical protein